MKHIISTHNSGTARDMGIKASDLDLKTLKITGRDAITTAFALTTYDLDDYVEANNAARAVDTVTLREPFHFEDPRVGGKLRRRLKEEAKGFEIAKYIGWLQTRTGAWVFIMYLPWTKSGGSYLYFTFSLAKVVQGNNYTNIRAGMDIIKDLNAEFTLVFEQLKMVPQDISLWECREIDFGLNFQVGMDPRHYITYLENQKVPHRR